MITAKEARALATKDARVTALLDSVDKLIRSKAPASSTQRATMLYRNICPADEQVVASVLQVLNCVTYGFRAKATPVEIEDATTTKEYLEIEILWSDNAQ